jgi:hypothetical protein
MNATINTFVESKKLQLKQSKCSVIHVGKHSVCPDLRVHKEKMHKEDSATYLGDIIHKSGKLIHNINERCIKAYSILAEIRAILQDVPLGKYKIQIGLQLRQAMFVNGILYNSEVWHSPTKEDIAKLEVIDHQIMKTICDAHSKTPIEFLYLETSENPLSYIISSRRVMYLHQITNKDENELVKKVFKAQCENPTKGDFIELVKEDLEKIGEKYDENIFQGYSKVQFKAFIKKHINEASFKYLKSLQIKHTKVQNIEYKEYKLQPYISDKKLSNKMVSVLFSIEVL